MYIPQIYTSLLLFFFLVRTPIPVVKMPPRQREQIFIFIVFFETRSSHTGSIFHYQFFFSQIYILYLLCMEKKKKTCWKRGYTLGF